MPKLAYLILFSILANIATGQNKEIKISEDSVISKWIKACINLEARSNFFTSKAWQDWQTKKAKSALDKQIAKNAQERLRKTIY